METASEWPAWPSYGVVDDLLPDLARWHARGRRVALATLVHITGSSPRPLGSEMAVSDSGEVAGYVSGGCVEAAVATAAREVIATSKPTMLDYGAGSPVLDVQLACGGRIGIFVRALPDLGTYVAALEQARARREALTVSIDLKRGGHVFGPATREPRTFRKVYLPPVRLVAIGGDPVTLALCRLAPALGFEVGLLRPYGPGETPPGATLFHYDPRLLDRALADLPLDAWTAVYTLTHDMDDDHKVLVHALHSSSFCVGVLGSRRKTDERLARLRADGVGEQALARLCTPAGVGISAREPREIALSILAEVVARRPRAEPAEG